MNISYKEEFPPIDYIGTLWVDGIELRMNAINAILSILKHTETVYGYKYTHDLVQKSAMDLRTYLKVKDGILDYNIYGLNERLSGELPAQIVNDLIYEKIDVEDACRKCSEYLDNVEIEDDIGEYDEMFKIDAMKKDNTTVKESTGMGLKEAKKILEAKGCKLLKEYNGALNIIIRTINKILTDNNIDGTVKEIELNTKLKPLGALVVTVKGAEKPYIIGYAENTGTIELGDYIVFTCDNKDSVRVHPVMRNCYSRAETYNCIIEKVKAYLQRVGV